jgi:hypothetical protein
LEDNEGEEGEVVVDAEELGLAVEPGEGEAVIASVEDVTDVEDADMSAGVICGLTDELMAP